MEATLHTQTRGTDKTMNELSSAVRDGEQLLGNTPPDGTEATRQIRARLQASIEKAKALCEQLQQKTVAAAKAADHTIREHPYQALGVAFGVGLLIGVLAARNRKD